ncbi:acyl-CoA dehydrogenase (plasmid) [Agrobacterium tumefaciens]|uniref:Acyl-CoA dehydrogenase n=1 Tax=Agrobacterium tumefaciens TaxID=358 RepID=A0AAP9J9I6_AGRTU|nr:acyl-CoA dehydrogenase family protein [Agrobacterium tumefaciens]NSZ60063.1 acyl-CoA dehydrogenase [Agrobacterium tumefaciens]QDY97663.1 acyl-CoA dehydrogenase [Agrobacterium tumefaciens]UXS27795.1 acyl-CoA dehydrogenase [Agrobacterium tumefaciens]UXS35369.1 acyl-CoA dehydrogenase [Agrobacterium tumefaciens]UXS50779.1 acyl-CoA dehydrogenase [Agrobacterium tumefaciens]
MNDTGYSEQAAIILRQIETVPGYAVLRERLGEATDISCDALEMVLGAAARFSEEILYPVNRAGDIQGCRLENGRVHTPDGYPDVWRKFVADGWNAIDYTQAEGGQGLPFFVNVACRELFDRAGMAFGMFGASSRAGSQVLAAYAEPALRDEWIAKFAEGRWSAAIAISEADAGSDVGRIRTRALPSDDGTWRITGEKMWTTFGDSDMVEGIGHFLLARTPDAPPGTSGLSLFLVPSVVPGDGGLVSNGVHVRRIEEKLGLHGSPTCVTGFEDAKGWLIGSIGRGLPQLFVMLQTMRVMVGVQGIGVAFGAAQTATRYASERRQGGDPAKPPTPIASHPDVQRLLLGMASRVEVLRGLALEMAIGLDALPLEPDQTERKRASDVIQWLMPILKAACSEAAFDVSSDAIQVLGGAGYTREWPVEQWLRDARMMSIAEGSSGIQALDLVYRKFLRDGGVGLGHFLSVARTELVGAEPSVRRDASSVLDRLERCAGALLALKKSPGEVEAGATAFLRLATLAATGWIAARLASLDPQRDTVNRRLIAAGRFWLSDLHTRAAFEEAQALAGSERLALFDALSPTT